MNDGLTHEQLVVACANIGYDLTCGQCASVFYTGTGIYPHDETCKTPKAPGRLTVEVSGPPLPDVFDGDEREEQDARSHGS